MLQWQVEVLPWCEDLVLQFEVLVQIVVLQFEAVLLQCEVVALQCEVVVLQRLLQDWLVMCRLTHSCPPVGPARLHSAPLLGDHVSRCDAELSNPHHTYNEAGAATVSLNSHSVLNTKIKRNTARLRLKELPSTLFN